MRLLVAVGIAAFALAPASWAQPVGATAAGDSRCLLAMVALSNSTNPSDQAFGQVGTVYFMGRIAGRDPGFDFGRLRSMAATMDARSAQTDLRQSCGPMFEKSMHQLTDALAGSAVATPH
ncbi:MAG TPA: hypothetical protein VJS38_17895 [Phenylobacterium sp.]|uniref:hypothetical protein n=1 Tax=Phenylobacterium sp. TaxID=1871053 RepID=UPI002B47E2F1|nr:hypothetical protein [Phenylobacterium sp.]HKR90044.1 hypothetical protein [Phenylobacterium sp.]